MKRLTSTSVLLLVALISWAQVTLNLMPGQRSHTIGDRHYGIFFEEINHAGDGGLYAELIRNRSFEDNDYVPEYWNVVGNGSIQLTDADLLNPAQRFALNVNINSDGAGVQNEGFWGMQFKAGETYNLTFWAKADDAYNGTITATLIANDGDTPVGSESKSIALTSQWQKVSLTITARDNATAGQFALTGTRGAMQIDMVSLFPTDTYKGRANGCRRDLAEKLEAMHPAFVRFPGGCYIEGEWRNDKPHFNGDGWTMGSTNRFEWKQTIGAIEERPGHWNINWNYRVSDGLGFHELLQLTEDLGAEPLFVVNMGMGHGWYEDYNNIQEYIQEALDAIEYCNGGIETKYGALRAKNGHPEPFNLRLIEIGNENYNFYANDNRDQSYHYAERYIQFYNAIKAVNPEIMCIGDVEAWSTDYPSWRNQHPVDAVDEHYYRNPGWFVNQYEKYDRYDRTTMKKVYAGEYAVTSDCSGIGDLKSALGEAIYMQGMENNSDICIMGSYAPIFVNENDQKWLPDMIRFNSSESYGTPSYYVQQLMPTYVGKQNIKWTELNNSLTNDTNRAGLSTWVTAAQFDNFRINGTVVPFGDGWTQPSQGIWTANGTSLTQNSTTVEGALYVCDKDLGDDYTIEVDATKLAGNEGFLIAFNYKDANNYAWLNLGGWNNTQHAIEVCANGAKTTVANTYGNLVGGETYNIRIEVTGGKTASCYLNNNLLFIANVGTAKQRKVYVSSNIDDTTGKLYVKLVNPNAEAQPTHLNLDGYSIKGAKLIQMTHSNPNAVNNTANQYNVVPTESSLFATGKSMDITVPGYSFNILELDVVEGEQEAKVESGTYYLYNKEKESFLSRGADWGTRATLDSYGVPVVVTEAAAGEYTIRYADDQRAMFLGYDVEPYTDKNAASPVSWQFVQQPSGAYALLNSGKNLWLKATDVNAGCTFDAAEANASEFYLLTVEQYKSIIAQNEAAYSKPEGQEVDLTNLLENPTMAQNLSGWDVAFSKGTTTRASLSELYEGYGNISQTITGLTPGVYRFTLQGFFRQASSEVCESLSAEGYQFSNAYIFANGIQSRFATWESDHTVGNFPNSMEEAYELISQGKYQNEVYCMVGEDGVLTIGLACPQRVPMQWLIWGNATLTRIIVPEDYTHLIVNPDFEYSLAYGWEHNGMQLQGNTEPKAGKHGNYYCERWTKAPASLPSTFVRQTITALPEGDYEITAFCHAENQSYPSLKVTGVSLFGNNSSVPVTDAQDYTVKVGVYDGTLTLGYMAENTDANWITVDNFRLKWVGESNAGLRATLENAARKLQELIDNKPILSDELREEAERSIANAEALLADPTTDEDVLKAAVEEINSLYDVCKKYRPQSQRKDPYERYLFTYFPSNSDENLYYAVSEDGFSYTPLNNGMRIMASDTVAIKRGIRDPHILRGVDGKTFYMVATDMRCAEGWASNRGIVMYKSTDMIHWQHATVHFPTRFAEKWSRVTRVWAPETIWDPDYVNADGTKGRYMVYFSLLTDDGTCTYDKVFYCYANDEFTDLITEPVFLYDRGSATIDADIVFDELDGLYHMIYKNEGSGGICSVTAKRLTAAEGEKPGSQWSKASATLQQTNVAVEGGGLFRLINTDTWVLMYDCYSSGYYQFCTTEDWETFTLEAQTQTWGAFTPRHGTVIPISAHEYNELLRAFPTNGIGFIDESNGIEAVKALPRTSETMYNLSGQRINKPAPGQIYLQGGCVVVCRE